MKVISVNIGSREEVRWDGANIITGILKKPTERPVLVTEDGLQDDNIIDTRVHGGEFQAVYAYFQSDYDWWSNEMKNIDFIPGLFGENLTVQGIDESVICLRDRLRVGEILLEAAHFRLPCGTFATHMRNHSFPKKFFKSKRFGIYFKVIEEGFVKSGDSVSIEIAHPEKLSFADIISAYVDRPHNEDLIRTVLSIDGVAPRLRERLYSKLS